MGINLKPIFLIKASHQIPVYYLYLHLTDSHGGKLFYRPVHQRGAIPHTPVSFQNDQIIQLAPFLFDVDLTESGCFLPLLDPCDPGGSAAYGLLKFFQKLFI